MVATEDGELKEVPQVSVASNAEEADDVDDASDAINKSEAIATEKADERDGEKTAS